MTDIFPNELTPRERMHRVLGGQALDRRLCHRLGRRHDILDAKPTGWDGQCQRAERRRDRHCRRCLVRTRRGPRPGFRGWRPGQH